MGVGEEVDAAGRVAIASRFKVSVADTSFLCRDDEHVLRAMITAGRAPLPIGCRSGGCGVCRVRVLSGAFAAAPRSRARVTAAEEAEGIALACRIFPRGDLVLEPLPWRRPGVATTGLAA